LGPEYIAKVALKAIAKVGIDTAEWQAHSLRGAAATHFMAKSGPDAVAQARGGWASAVSMATHHARQHQVIPWERLASSPLGSTLGPGVIASSSSSVLPRASLHSTFSISLGVRKTGIFAGWCKSFGARGEAEVSRVAREAAAPLPGSLRLGGQYL